MLAVNYSAFRSNLKSYCDKVTDENETVIITRKADKNVVLISLKEYNELMSLLKKDGVSISKTEDSTLI